MVLASRLYQHCAFSVSTVLLRQGNSKCQCVLGALDSLLVLRAATLTPRGFEACYNRFKLLLSNNKSPQRVRQQTTTTDAYYLFAQLVVQTSIPPCQKTRGMSNSHRLTGCINLRFSERTYFRIGMAWKRRIQFPQFGALGALSRCV